MSQFSGGGGTVIQGSGGTTPWLVEITADGVTILGTLANPIRTDPTGTTVQPVSGTVALSASSAVIGHVIVDSGGGSSNTQYADGVTQATPTGTAAMGKDPSNVIHALALDAAGNLKVNVAAELYTLGQKVAASSVPVVLASDQTAVPVSGTVAVSSLPTVTTDPSMASSGLLTRDVYGFDNREFMQLMLLELRAIRAALTFMASEDGSSLSNDFEPSSFGDPVTLN